MSTIPDGVTVIKPPAKPRKHITHYTVTNGKDTCMLAGFSLHKNGVFLPQVGNVYKTQFAPDDTNYPRSVALHKTRGYLVRVIERTVRMRDELVDTPMENQVEARVLLRTKGRFWIKAHRA